MDGINTFLWKYEVQIHISYTQIFILMGHIRSSFSGFKKVQNYYFLFKTKLGIRLKKELVICSPNCVQIWKGRDRKTVFCRVRHKKCRAKGETFFYVEPCKKTVFWLKPFYMRTKFWEHNFFCRNCTFFKARGLANSCLLH